MEVVFAVKEPTHEQTNEYLGIEMVSLSKCINCQNKYKAFAVISVGSFRGYADEEVQYYSDRNFENDSILRARLLKAARTDLRSQMRAHLDLIQPHISITFKD